jgi:hypothetical protein
MRLDQYQKLQALQEKLLDVFLDEAEPTTWPGRGLKLGEMDAKTRGDLYWVRKTAASALLLADRVSAAVGRVQMTGDGPSPTGAPAPDSEGEADQMETELGRYERQAQAIMAELQSGKGKAAFDKKVHGPK